MAATWGITAELSPTDLEFEDFTYGVELEFVFAFEQSLLQPLLNHGIGGRIQKILPYATRNSEKLNSFYSPSATTDRPYNSWTINVPQRSGPPLIRAYQDEPLRIAQSYLRQAGVPVQIRAETEPKYKTNDRYSSWHLISDCSVRGVGAAGIHERLGDRVSSDNQNSWDSWGMEAVTPIMKFVDHYQNMSTIEKVINVIRGGPDQLFGAFITNQAGFHVHVGAPKDLDVIRELMYICTVYEDQISRMHPPCRQPAHPCGRMIIDTNREFWIDNSDKPDIRNIKEIPLRRIRQDIETFPADDPEDTGQLHEIMCPAGEKRHIVNWTYIGRSDSNLPRTIEFRQHRGTLDIQEIDYWTFFVVGLVRVAKIYQKMEGGCPVRDWRQKISIYDLFRDMNMPNEMVDFWTTRIAMYTCYPEDGPLNATDTEPPPTSTDEIPEMAKAVGNTIDISQITMKTGMSLENELKRPISMVTGEEVETAVRPPKRKKSGTVQDTYPDAVIMEAPMCDPRDDMIFNSEWDMLFVNTFNINDWDLQNTDAWGPGQEDSDMCGIYAVLQSLGSQYPGDAVVRGIGFDYFLNLVRNPPNDPFRYEAPFDEDQLATGLHAIDRGGDAPPFKLVICSESHDANKIARAVRVNPSAHSAFEFGDNVYVYHTDHYKGTVLGHWQGMNRKATEVIPTAVVSKPGTSAESVDVPALLAQVRPEKYYQPSGEVIPAGILDPLDEMLNIENMSVFVNIYNPLDWEVFETSAQGPQGGKQNFSGIWALQRSLQYQYPEDERVGCLSFQELLKAVQQPSVPRPTWLSLRVSNFQDWQMQLGLESIGDWKLVVCTEGGGRCRARRGGNDPTAPGRNLYVMYNNYWKGNDNANHWRAMDRKRRS